MIVTHGLGLGGPLVTAGLGLGSASQEVTQPSGGHYEKSRLKRHEDDEDEIAAVLAIAVRRFR